MNVRKPTRNERARLRENYQREIERAAAESPPTTFRELGAVLVKATARAIAGALAFKAVCEVVAPLVKRKRKSRRHRRRGAQRRRRRA